MCFFFLNGAWAACLSGSLEIMDLSAPMLREAEETVSEFEAVMRAELSPHENLIVNLESLNPRVNAEIKKEKGEIIINVMGGMISHPMMDHNTLKLLLCHEMGHLLGGPPLKSRTGWSSTEGQADYYSTLSCVKRFRFDEKLLLKSAVSLASIYAEVTRENAPRLETCDERKVERTNYGYPPVQCRLDTLLAGWQERPRPLCWFRE
jgi:hypothetical protein